MKLVRFGEIGSEKPGLLQEDGSIVDVSDQVNDFNEEFFEKNGLENLKSEGKKVASDVRLSSPVARPSKIICIGLNYSDHAAETGAKLPSEPVLFFKATSSLCGPNDNLVIPKNSQKTDWEVELAVVIGKRASYVSESEAMDYVAGYCLHNDYSEREFQLEREGQWVKGKSCDTFAPLGPYLATKDEIADVDNLRLWLKVNNETVQDSNTSNLVFKIPHLISYISQFMTLFPGDVISTGTPAGVGLGFEPPVFVKAGDVIELGIDGLGESKQIATNYEEAVKLAANA